MLLAKYQNPSSLTVSSILGDIDAHNIAVPEIQRPFVWKKTQVRDFLDSLYRGYPAGYIILWLCPSLRMKDGKVAAGRKIIIDGQQRIMALMSAISGKEIVNKEYKKDRIKIAFNPFAALSEDPDAEIFAVQDQSHIKNKRWISDIAPLFKEIRRSEFVKKYCASNPDMDPDNLHDIIDDLRAIVTRSIGVIELNEQLDINIVTDIFIRINSKGTPLSQGDFVMSKIASDDTHGGKELRKLIDYFAHLSKVPSFYPCIKENDEEFASTDYINKISWLKNEVENVFNPDCDDMIRVAFMHKWPRAKLAELVGMLSGRDFGDRVYKEEIVESTYNTLKKGILNVINENNFKQFMLTIRGAGFVSPRLISSKMALDFAYSLFLRLRQSNHSEAKRIVQKWYVLSLLTGRYSSSPESAFAKDLKRIMETSIPETFADIEAATLSDTFWNETIPDRLRVNVTNSPAYQVYLAAQVAMGDISLLSANVKVEDLLTIQGDAHHVFPKKYLMENGYQRNQYNQNANFALLDTDVNKSIGKRSPKEYFAIAFNQCSTKVATCGTIMNVDQLRENMRINCIPDEIINWDFSNYDEFLKARRLLMANKIRLFYESL